MTPAAIIERAMAEGVNLALSDAGTIKATGDSAAVSRWLPAIREHKPGIVTVLQGPRRAVPPPDPSTEAPRQRERPANPGDPVTQKERAELAGLITAAAAFYGFTPEETSEAREVAAGDVRAALTSFRATAKRYGLSTYPDDRVMCRDCGNLNRSGQCLAAQHGLMPDTYPGYHPVPDVLRNCEHFK